MSPDGTQYGILLKNGFRQEVRLFDYQAFYSGGKYMASPMTQSFMPTAFCYTPDGKSLWVADDQGVLHRYNVGSLLAPTGRQTDRKVKLSQQSEMRIGIAASRLAISSNGKWILAASDRMVRVFSLTDRTQLKEIVTTASVVDAGIPADNSYMAILQDDGSLLLYDMEDFRLKNHVKALGLARQMAIHPNSKYLAVITADNSIAIINTLDIEDRQYIYDNAGSIQDVCFVADERTWLGYNTPTDMVFREMSDLKPYLRQLLRDELASRMAEWTKRMPDETLQEYNLRMSEDNRALLISLLEEEIATRMAEEALTAQTITLGGYNYNEGMLSIDIGAMPSIFLQVPENELYNFASADQLEYRNAE